MAQAKTDSYPERGRSSGLPRGTGYDYRLSAGHASRGHASNAVEAVAEFRRHRPDVTLMDLGFLAPTEPTFLSQSEGNIRKLVSLC